MIAFSQIPSVSKSKERSYGGAFRDHENWCILMYLAEKTFPEFFQSHSLCHISAFPGQNVGFLGVKRSKQSKAHCPLRLNGGEGWRKALPRPPICKQPVGDNSWFSLIISARNEEWGYTDTLKKGRGLIIHPPDLCLQAPICQKSILSSY